MEKTQKRDVNEIKEIKEKPFSVGFVCLLPQIKNDFLRKTALHNFDILNMSVRKDQKDQNSGNVRDIYRTSRAC